MFNTLCINLQSTSLRNPLIFYVVSMVDNASLIFGKGGVGLTYDVEVDLQNHTWFCKTDMA